MILSPKYSIISQQNINNKKKYMKSILLTLTSILVILGAQAQETKTIQENKAVHQTRTVDRGDSIRVVADSTIVDIKNDGEKKRVKITFEYGKETIDKYLKDSTEKKVFEPKKKDNFFAGVTFSNFDLGLAKMLDHGKLSLSSENEFLRYKNWKSVNVGFDVLQMGYKFTDQFKMTIAAGFDWTHFRLKENVLMLEDTRPLGYVDSDIDYSKNRFSSSYLRIPLTFEIRTKAGAFPERFHLAAGPIAGILLQGSQKLKSKEEGKRKVKDDFNFAPFTYGAFARISYGSVGLYAKYYFNDMFVIARIKKT